MWHMLQSTQPTSHPSGFLDTHRVTHIINTLFSIPLHCLLMLPLRSVIRPSIPCLSGSHNCDLYMTESCLLYGSFWYSFQLSLTWDLPLLKCFVLTIQFLETPWVASMSSKSTFTPEKGPSVTQPTYDPNPPTVAAFSPVNIAGASIASKQRSTIIVHKKSPLLVATPPQITRALAYSHPFLLPLNRLAGLLTWSTDDPWASFLLVAGFWGTVLYGSHVVRWAGPIIIVTGLILGMYSRRYSPLSSTAQTGEKHEKGHKRDPSESSLRHHKSLDEIVETLREFTTRCNVLLDPLLRLTDFLSTQRTATSATTRPALTTLFIRILLVTPLWVALTLPPLHILTTRRVILLFGTVALTWHSRPARVSRVILWRSLTLRRFLSFVTGLALTAEDKPKTKVGSLAPPLPPRIRTQAGVASDFAMKRRPDSSGVRFTFILFENQRRWIGLGWTTSLFAYERGAWTDEHLNAAPTMDDFELPHVQGGHARWRWVEGSEWKVEGGGSGTASPLKGAKDSDGGGWIYYDNKWNDGKRDVDSWGRYTRRRKWYRDAELVEVTASTEVTPSPTPNSQNNPDRVIHSEAEDENKGPTSPGKVEFKDEDSASGKAKKKPWFGKKERRPSTGSSDKKSSSSVRSDRDGPDDDHVDKWKIRERDEGSRNVYGLGEDAVMGLS